MLRAEALIELGQYNEAVREAKTALGKVRDHMTTGIWSPKIYRLSLMGTLGLAHALGGATKRARTQAEELENFSLGLWASPSHHVSRQRAGKGQHGARPVQ
jgi:hypothetical protein